MVRETSFVMAIKILPETEKKSFVEKNEKFKKQKYERKKKLFFQDDGDSYL